MNLPFIILKCQFTIVIYFIFFTLFCFRLHNKGVYFRAGIKKMVKGYSRTFSHEVEIEVISLLYEYVGTVFQS